MLERGFLLPFDKSDESPTLSDPAVSRNDELSEIYIHITNRCNLRCRYCYNAVIRKQHSKHTELSLQEIKQLLNQANEMSVKRVVFTGGEPLLRKECLDAAQYARFIGLQTSCLTNGTMLESLHEKISSAFDQVVVSIDSWRPEEQIQLRPGIKLETIINGIRKVVDSHCTSVWLRPVITRLNLESLPDFPKFAASELNCTNFIATLVSPTIVDDLIDLDLLPQPADYQSTLHRFYQALAFHNGNSSLDTTPLETIRRCGAGTGLLSIAPNGDVYPCQCLHFPELYSGNIRRQGLADIWMHSESLISMRKLPTPRFKACANCAILNLCSMACRATHYAFSKSEEYFTSSMCPLERAEVEERLWNGADATQHIKVKKT
jgi:radical SAM protein with 4Fe4S-binding SPASM domain